MVSNHIDAETTASRDQIVTKTYSLKSAQSAAQAMEGLGIRKTQIRFRLLGIWTDRQGELVFYQYGRFDEVDTLGRVWVEAKVDGCSEQLKMTADSYIEVIADLNE